MGATVRIYAYSLIASAVISGQALGGAPMTIAEVLEAGQKTAASTRDDPFSTANDAALAGREIEVSIPVASGSASGPRDRNLVFWSYDSAAQVLRLVAGPVTFERKATGPNARFFERLGNPVGFYVTRTSRVDGEFVGSNAYGASTIVTQTSAEAVAIVAFDRFDSGFFVEPDIMHPRPDHFEVVLPMSPDEARRSTEGLKLEIMASVAPVQGRRAVLCDPRTKPATVSSPTLDTEFACLIAVDPVSARFVTADGRALANWKP